MDLDDFMNPSENLTPSQFCERIEMDNRNVCINTQDIKTIDFDDLDFLSQDIKTDLVFFSCEIDDATLSQVCETMEKEHECMNGIDGDTSS